MSENSNIISVKTAFEVVDVDGNVYNVVTIGSQQWMVENLKTTKYADGTPIPNLTLDADWIAEDGTPGHDGAYCWYNNDIANKTPYGALYNWYAVNNAHGLSPTGWRVPTKTDWETLIVNAGGTAIAGEKLREVGPTHWNAINTGTDDYGFKLVASGERYFVDGTFYSKGDGTVDAAVFAWASTLLNAQFAYELYVDGRYAWATVPWDFKWQGNNVRCMRDI